MGVPKKELEQEIEIREDDALVKRAQEGEPSAFDELVLRHNKRLYGLVYHMTQNPEDTYDLLQDVFAKAYRSIKGFKGKSSFYTWIYTIAVNMTINHLKKRKRKFALSLDNEDLGIKNDPSLVDMTSYANPRREVDLKILQRKLNETLMELSEQHRAVVVMFDIQGMPHAEISRILGVSEGTVRSRLFYAHKNLQTKLESFKNSL